MAARVTKASQRRSTPPKTLQYVALEADVEANLAQEGRGPAHPARQRPRAIGPSLRFRDTLARHFSKGTQKVGFGLGDVMDRRSD